MPTESSMKSNGHWYLSLFLLVVPVLPVPALAQDVGVLPGLVIDPDAGCDPDVGDVGPECPLSTNPFGFDQIDLTEPPVVRDKPQPLKDRVATVKARVEEMNGSLDELLGIVKRRKALAKGAHGGDGRDAKAESKDDGANE